jgi:FKBP-type peptidyl-prolyl cis-trans isomerase
MATKKSQRIGIWIIAIVMLVGTVGSFAAMIVGTQNSANDQKKFEEAYAAYQKQLDEQKKLAKELSDKYYGTFKPYQSSPAAFDASTVGQTVITNDLKVGDGAEITKDTKYLAYYVGWNPSGKTFDSSFDGETLKAPLDTTEATLISGWNDGVVGMKVGGVRELTIPAALAYGDTGSGEDIPANTPIKFVIMIIATK